MTAASSVHIFCFFPFGEKRKTNGEQKKQNKWEVQCCLPLLLSLASGQQAGASVGCSFVQRVFLWGDGWLFDAKHHYFSILPMQRRLEGKKKGEFKWSGKKGEKCSNSILAHFPFPSLPLFPSLLPILHTPYRESPPLLSREQGGSCLLALQACGRGRKGQIDKLTKKTSHFLCASFSPTAMIKTKFGLN